jgi:hypothetical protein
MPNSWKVGVKTKSDPDWIYNALRFATKEAAEKYGADLAMRWIAVTEWEAHESLDAPNVNVGGHHGS